MNSDNAIVFSASEVCGMSDEELFENFVKICTVSNLQCKHCCKKRNDINIYKQKIRMVCNKKGLNSEIIIKTCDIQQANNSLKNNINNPLNNDFYRKIKKPEMEIKNQEKLLEQLDSKYNEKIHYDCIIICNELINKRILEGRTTGKYKIRELPGEKLIEPTVVEPTVVEPTVVEPIVESVVFTIPEICKIVNDLDILTKRIQELTC
jgi:hypothetical protein